MKYQKRTIEDADNEIQVIEEKLKVMRTWLRKNYPKVLVEWDNTRLFKSIYGGSDYENA